MPAKSILITGGAGFIGSHCALILLENGYKVLVADSGSNVRWGKADDDKPECLIRVEELTGEKIEFVKLNLLDYEGLKKYFSEHDVDCVIHCAALKSVKESVDDPLSYYINNVCGSINLFSIMSKYGIKKLIFSSSATVYGKPQFLPFTEKHPTGQNIASPYGKTKFVVEEALRDLCISENWQVYALRYFNPVGAHPSGRIGEDPASIPTNLMPIIVQVASGKRKILDIYGNDYDTEDGTGVRDYIHIMDLAEGHLAAVKSILTETSDQNIFKAYNLGRGSGISVLQVVNTFESVNNVKIPFKYENRRKGDIPVSYCASNLAEQDLNWKANLDLEAMCRDSWNWQTKNPNGYEN